MSNADQLVIVYLESKDVDEHLEDEGEFLQGTLEDDDEESNQMGLQIQCVRTKSCKTSWRSWKTM